MKACLLLLALALTACMSTPESATHAATPVAASASVTISAATLARDHWQLRDAVDGNNQRLDALFGKPDKPLQLDFSTDRVSVHNACNNISGSYAIVEGHLIVAQLRQTMMACADPTLMQRETIIKGVLQGKPMLIITTAGDTPELTLAAESGQSLTFIGKQTAETRSGGPGETMFLEVAADTTPCNHPLVAQKSCLSVRELHYDAQGLRTGQPGPWQSLQQDIEGYVHRPDTRNVLRVKRYTLKQAPADTASTMYVLDMVVESEMVKPSGPNDRPDLPQHP